ncbi:MAG: deoxyribonuclease II family protein [Acidobacteriia bacterium]|nr:deoxyribonuclease II family protein [Terriglobia bacterium]
MKIRFGSLFLMMLWGITLLGAPVPLLKTGQPVDWWFVFKFNAESFPECGGSPRTCAFGGTVQPYKSFGQQFAFASSADGTLRQGGGCVGETATDPVGATFDQVYNGKFFYVLWNDQFYGDPIETQFAPAGHSKGMLAWNGDGDGMVLQVSTPSWPASGSASEPRKTDGNTLGCVADDNVLVSQHFFALKLNKADVVAVLKALANASVVTDPAKLQIVNNGGPADIQELVRGLGKISSSKTATLATLSSGVQLISKPSDLNVPPWQMVSALLGGEPLRVASWWAAPEIPTTSATTPVACWDASLGKPGAVEIATSGTWQGKTLGFEGVAEPEGNHAKIGVSSGWHPYVIFGGVNQQGMLPGPHCDQSEFSPECGVRRNCPFGFCKLPYVIFGDMNQQGTLSGPLCDSSQNGRGGLFFAVQDPQLFNSVHDLLQGQTAPQ